LSQWSKLAISMTYKALVHSLVGDAGGDVVDGVEEIVILALSGYWSR
jgi:hypothetical protein